MRETLLLITHGSILQATPLPPDNYKFFDIPYYNYTRRDRVWLLATERKAQKRSEVTDWLEHRQDMVDSGESVPVLNKPNTDLFDALIGNEDLENIRHDDDHTHYSPMDMDYSLMQVVSFSLKPFQELKNTLRHRKDLML